MVTPSHLWYGFWMMLSQCIIPVCCTCSLAEADHKEWAERKARKRKLRERPDPLPRRKANFSQMSLPSSSKPLPPLLRLPIEVRLIIWKYAVGGNRFELVHRSKEIVLQKRLFMDIVNVRGGIMVKQRVDWKKQYYHLSLACTCHQIYREVIDLLYNCNTFITKDPYAVTDLVLYRLQPQRYHAIRVLELTWSLPSPIYDPLTRDEPYVGLAWVDCFTVIATKLKLSSLKVILRVPVHDHWLRDDLRTDARWLQPLLGVANVERLKIVFKIEPEGPLSRAMNDSQIRALEVFERDTVAVLTEKGNQVISYIDAQSGRGMP
ncbi:MAG: hypothetical protein Q9225_007381 [Loekoesia sp. 1 TL-2023]